MRIEYHPHRSRIVEYLFVPKILLDKSLLEDMPAKERILFEEPLQVLHQIAELLAPLKDRVTKHYAWGKGFSLLHTAYFYLLHEGKDPIDLPAFYQELRALSEEELDGIFCSNLIEAGEGKLKEDVWELLEDSYLEAEQKWYWARAIRNKRQAIEQAIAILEEVTVLYDPFYEAAAAEREAFATSFSLEAFWEKFPDMALSSVEGVPTKLVQRYILSPWVFGFAYYANVQYVDAGVAVCLSVGIDQLFGMEQELDVETMSNLLKTLSDTTRYQVMVEMIQPHAKSKDVAEKLGITGAAVSFHTQKLVNAQLLLYNTQDKHIKFDANKALLRQIADRLVSDFSLEEEV